MLRRMDLGGLTQEFQWAFSPKGLHTKNWFTRFWTPQEPCFSEYISKLLGWQFSYHLLGWVTQKLQLPISQEPLKTGFHFLPHSTPQVAYYLEYIAKPLGQTINIFFASSQLCILLHFFWTFVAKTILCFGSEIWQNRLFFLRRPP